MNNQNNPILELLNKPATLVVIGLGIFIMQYWIVVSMMDIRGPYNLTGMWITVPDFAQRLNDPGSTLERVFTRLNGWDGQWYFHIAQNGYHCPTVPESNNPNICNVGFFPLVPALGATLGKLGIDLVYAIPLVSQLAWLASILLILFFVRSLAPIQPLHILIVIALVAYPGSMYGFVSYSESMLTLLMLLITAVTYWYLNNPRPMLLGILAIACFMISLVKTSGMIGLAIPVLMALLHPASNGQWFSHKQIRLYCASAAGLLGILAFLGYCEIRFDDWALYFRYVGGGWGSAAAGAMNMNPFSVFTGFSWHDYIPLRISNVIVVSLPGIIVLLALALVGYRKSLSFLYIPIGVTVVLLFYLYAVLGNADPFNNYNIARHMFPVVALITLLAMLLVNRDQPKGLVAASVLASLALISIQFYAQIHMLEAFRFGHWVS